MRIDAVHAANSTHEPELFARLMRGLDPSSATYGEAGAALVKEIKALFEKAAHGGGAPREKVTNLRHAQQALAALELAVKFRPRTAGYDVSLTGLEDAKAALAALEATFCAFGWTEA